VHKRLCQAVGEPVRALGSMDVKHEGSSPRLTLAASELATHAGTCPFQHVNTDAA